MVAPTNCGILEINRNRIPLEDAQTQMVEDALKVGAQYILFIEDDTEPPPNTIVELTRVLETAPDDVMAAGGIYSTRGEAPEPVVYLGPNSGSYWKWKAGDVFPCWCVGFGCLMIKTKVFELMPKPWFKTLETVEQVREYPDLFPHAFDQHCKKVGVSTDIFFYTKLAKMGYKVLAHGGVLAKHWDAQRNKAYTLPETSYPMQKEIAVEA